MSVNNLTDLEQTFSQNTVDHKLRNLATHLTQIQTLSNDPASINRVHDLISESRYFIEWTVPDMDIDQGAELVDLGRFLTRWLFDWEESWSNTGVKEQIIQEVAPWPKRVLQMSEFFSRSQVVHGNVSN